MPPPAPRRILYVLNSPSTGGANRSLSVLLAGLDRARFSPRVVVPKPGPLLDRLQAMDVPVHILPLPSLARLQASFTGKIKAAVRNGRNVLRLARLIRRDRIGLVHTNTIFPLGGALAARLAGVPHVWHLREGMDAPMYNLRLGRGASLRLMASLSAALICISHYVESVSVLATARGKAVIIPNALESLPEAIPRPLSEPLTIGCVGLISQQKRTRVFVEAAALIAAARPESRFVVAGRAGSGDENLLAECRERVRELGIDDRFEWPGFVADPTHLYRRMHLLIHPAVHEGFGRVLIEAMSWGIPVVAVDSGASPELIQDGTTGRIVTADDPRAIADAALGIVATQAGYARMGAAARAELDGRFGPGDHARDVIGVYDHVLGSPL